MAEKDKRTNNDLQNIIQKTKDRSTRKPLKTGGESILRSSNTNPTKNQLYWLEKAVTNLDPPFPGDLIIYHLYGR